MGGALPTLAGAGNTEGAGPPRGAAGADGVNTDGVGMLAVPAVPAAGVVGVNTVGAAGPVAAAGADAVVGKLVGVGNTEGAVDVCVYPAARAAAGM